MTDLTPKQVAERNPRVIGERNRAAVRALLASHLGISRREIGARLGLSPMTVVRHVAALRAEWGGDTLPTKRGRA